MCFVELANLLNRGEPKMKKLLFVAMTTAIISSCASNDFVQIPTEVKGMVFNDIGSTYLERPTRAYLIDYPDGSKSLEYVVESYRMQAGSPVGIALKIQEKNVSEHLAAFNKFLDWDKLAKQRKDNFSKEIAIVPTTNGYNVYAFHSGNKNTNVLVSCFSMTNSSGCGYDAITFTPQNVHRIIKEAEMLKNKTLKPVDTSIYQ